MEPCQSGLTYLFAKEAGCKSPRWFESSRLRYFVLLFFVLYNKDMITIQTFLQTIWASILVLGWFKVIVAVVIISILSRMLPLMGLLAFALFVAYLAHWI